MMLSGRSFWRLMGLVVTVNCVVIGMVVSLTIRAGPRIVEVSPGEGAEGVSTSPTIRVTYRRPIEAATLRDAIHLEPAVNGIVEVEERGVSFRPLHPLLPNTHYRVVLAPGIREASGQSTSRETATTFRTRASRLVVLRRDGSAWGLWVLDPTAQQEQRIVRGWESNGRDSPPPPVATSPDGSRVAYVVPSDEQNWSLWIANVDDGQRKAILRDQSGAVSAVTWSPRGDLIAYEQRAILPGVMSTPKIWIVSEDGTQTALVYGRGQENGSSPSWGPDGARLSFYENRLAAIVVFGFAGNLQTIRSEVAQAVRWSPDGQKVAIVTRSAEQRGKAGISLVDFSEPETTGSFWHDGDQTEQSPAWSPDGNSLAYVRSESANMGVWVGDLDGRNARPVHQGTGWLYSRPVWSPDGSALAFSRQPLRAGALETDPELWVVRMDGTAHRLTYGGWLVSWTP